MSDVVGECMVQAFWFVMWEALWLEDDKLVCGVREQS